MVAEEATTAPPTSSFRAAYTGSRLTDPRTASPAQLSEWYEHVSNKSTELGHLLAHSAPPPTCADQLMRSLIPDIDSRSSEERDIIQAIKPSVLWHEWSAYQQRNTRLFDLLLETVDFPATVKGQDDRRLVFEKNRYSGNECSSPLSDGHGFITWILAFNDMNSAKPPMGDLLTAVVLEESVIPVMVAVYVMRSGVSQFAVLLLFVRRGTVEQVCF